MSYSATWNNANAQGRLEAGVQYVCLSDPQELLAAINRRRLLSYQNQQAFSSQIYSGAYVKAATVATASAPPFDNLRDSLASKILSPPLGIFGGEPPTPSAMDWLWPIGGDDENKILISGAAGVDEGQVGLFQKLNSTNHWTDPTLIGGETSIRAVHFNELRQATEWIHRGRWKLPIYFSAGIISILPDTPWIPEAIANNGSDELRSLGFVIIRTEQTPARGLVNVTVRNSSRLYLTAESECDVDIYRVKREIDFASDPPTWNDYDPSEGGAWAIAGCDGASDRAYIGSMSLVSYVENSITGANVAAAFQAMIDGEEQNVMVRRSDTSPYNIGVTGRIALEFDMNSPPN